MAKHSALPNHEMSEHELEVQEELCRLQVTESENVIAHFAECEFVEVGKDWPVPLSQSGVPYTDFQVGDNVVRYRAGVNGQKPSLMVIA